MRKHNRINNPLPSSVALCACSPPPGGIITRPLGGLKAAARLILGVALLFGLAPHKASGQCNPAGNPTRYEFNINPTSMLNLVGQQFCTSQSQGTNCCGQQNSYRCLDLVFNLQNGPGGQQFGTSCQGMVNLMTANGNFDALFLTIGIPNPAGNSTNCAAPVNLGNNHTISLQFAGNAMGQVVVTLTVKNAMGVSIYNTTATANPGQAVILTLCKPGFGCVEDEIVFGCCGAGAALALAPGAPPVICAGASSALKISGLNGTPPYSVMVRAASAADTSYFPVTVNNDQDGNSAMDTAIVSVAPLQTTTYTAISVEDHNGCVQPVSGQSVTITVNPLPAVSPPPPSQEVCSGDNTTPVAFAGPVPGTVYGWTNSNTSIGLAASGSGDIPAFTALNSGNTVQTASIAVTPSATANGITCTGAPVVFTISVFPRPTVFAGNDQTICQNQAANLAAVLSGGASGGSWSGGSGTFGNPFAPNTTYTPSPAEYGTPVNLIFTTNDPPGPCPAVSDALILNINTLPTVNAGTDVMICKNEDLQIAKLGASIQSNGSGVSAGYWTSAGSGNFQPTGAFPEATTYVPSNADRLAGHVTLTLISADPPGPCPSVSDEVTVFFQPSVGMVCNDTVMISLDADGMVEVLPDMILEGNYVDSLFLVDLFLNGVKIGNKVNCTHIGKSLVARVTDNCSGVFCTGVIIVKDNLAPELQCKDLYLSCVLPDFSPDYLKNGLGIADVYPVVLENCNQYNLTYKDTWVNLGCNDDYASYIKRVWTAVDPSGNKKSCTQFLYLNHQHIGDVFFPADVALSCSGQVNTSPQATGAPYLKIAGKNFPIWPDDGKCNFAVSFTDQKLKQCDGTYDIVRTWVVYDMCLPTTPMPPTSNPKFVIQLIKVVDNSGPVLNCPASLTVSTDPLTCCATVDMPDAIVEDACSRVKSGFATIEVRDQFTGAPIDLIVLNGTVSDFPGNDLSDPDTLLKVGLSPCLPLGSHKVTYTAEDNCGNTGSCSFTLKVEDQTPPVAACDEITQVALGIDGMILVNATTFDDGSYDNCAGTVDVSFKARRLEANDCQANNQFYDQVKFCCSDINDTVLVILRVYDVPVVGGPVALDYEEKNSNECLVQVYIEDKLKPICQAPGNVTVSCENFDPSLWAYGAATAHDNCCVDTILTQANYSQFDTVCHKGTITRTFKVLDCGGLSAQCTQRVYVNYKQDYYVRFPNDWILTYCDGSFNYGEPTFYGEDCELLGVSYEDQIFTVVPDACFKIERTWTIINWCTYNPNKPCTYVPNPNPNATLNHPSNLLGPTVSAPGTLPPWASTVTKVNPGDPAFTDFSVYWSADANCYKYKQIIKFIDTQKPEAQCPASPQEVCDLSSNNAQLWNAPEWYDAASGAHDLCEAPTDLCLTGSDGCGGANINFRYLLFLDLDNNGSMESVISSTNPPPPGIVYFGNANNPNYLGGTPRVFDQRPVPQGQQYQFALETSTSGFNKTACLRWNTAAAPGVYTVPEFPYGTHKIKWFVEDGCGNERVCEYTFIVKDCKPPTVVCYNGLSTNLMPPGMAMINWEFFKESAYDNCTPADLLTFGVRESGTGTGFPLNPDGSPQSTVSFDCADQGFNLVELWVRDLAGNSDFCQTYVHIQDNVGACSPGTSAVAGLLKTESGAGLEDVDVQLQSTSAGGQAPVSLLVQSDQQGYYVFPDALPLSANAVIAPLKDNDPLNGVSTFDLVLINKHILGLAPLNSPYKMIAADANSSRSITTFDIVELRKLILGIYTELPNNTAWRFVDKSYVFPAPDNPFQEIFPETKELANIQSDQLVENFVAVKTGDVNGNAITNSLQGTEERSAGTLLFDLQDRLVGQDAVFTVSLDPDAQVAGYQFTLAFPGLEIVEIQPTDGIGLDNFGIFPEEHLLTVSCNAEAGQGHTGGFSITFRAHTAGLLSQMLQLSSRVTKAEAYRWQEAGVPEMLDIGLRFGDGLSTTINQVGFELYQNQPNPWTNKTRIDFHLPESAEATFSVFDESGRILYADRKFYQRGYNNVTVDNHLLEEDGLLYYKLETAKGSATRKMIRMQ